MSAATRPQIGKIHAMLAGLHVTDRPQKLTVVGAVIWQDIASTNDLTRDQAHVVIETLQAIGERPDPAGELARMVERRVSS